MLNGNLINKILNFLIIFGAFSIWLPTAIMSLTVILVIFFGFLSFSKLKIMTIINRPDYFAPILLFLLYIVGSFYSTAPLNSSAYIIIKYLKLLLIPIIACSISDDRTRKYAILAFIFGAIFTLFISYFKWFGWLPGNMGLHDHFYGGPDGYSHKNSYYAFKNTIAHGVIMSFALFIFLTKALLLKKNINLKWLFLSGLTFFNIMYLGFSRTGQIVAIIVVIYIIFKWLGLKSILILSLIALTGFIFERQIEQFLPQRLIGINQELNEHHSNTKLTSAGERMEMYKISLELIKKSPILGSGTGSLEFEYRKSISTKDTLLRNVTNVHNQFLLTFVELGAIGFCIILYMFFTHWRILNQNVFKYSEYTLYAKGLVLVIISGSLFNSLLLDAGEGRFYCIMAGVILSSFKPKQNKIRPIF